MNKQTFDEQLRANPDQLNPIFSSVIEEDPFIAPLVVEFVNYLPTRIYNLDSSYKENDWKTFEREAHSMIIAETYGYAELTKLAEDLELATQEFEINKIDDLFNEMKILIKRIEAGVK